MIETAVATVEAMRDPDVAVGAPTTMPSGAPPKARASRPVASLRRLLTAGDLTIFVEQDPTWCGTKVTLYVTAPNETPFQGDRVALQRLLGQARLVLEEDCPAARELAVVGTVGGTPVYEGTAARERGWVLADRHRLP